MTTETSPHSRIRRRWFLIAVSAAVCGGGIFAFSPQREHFYKCPLTGRGRVVITRLGLTLSDEVNTNSVSVWAEANGMVGIVPGQCGWTPIGTVTSRLFSPPRFAENMVFMIPYRLHAESLKIPGMTREAALRDYQREIKAAHTDKQPLWQVEQKFAQLGGQ